MDWTIGVIKPDEEGIKFYLRSYKPFRLLSLQLSPEAFCSTYARTAELDDDAWERRILSPTATTFVATTQTDDGERRVVSSLILVTSESNDLPGPMRWDVNAVYTLPEARRRGLASAVIDFAKGFARAEAESQGRDWILTAVVLRRNAGAQRLYAKLGFKARSLKEDGVEMVFAS